MNQRTRFVGLDVHKDTIAVAIADEGVDPQSWGTIANDPQALRKLVRSLDGPGVKLAAAYEAGPTGFAVQRLLTSLQVQCQVIAPSLVPRRPGDRIKTDKRDAVNLARLLRSGDLTPIWIPDQEHEALRSLVRARADARVDQLRARHRLSKFLLRQGIVPPPGIKAWTAKHKDWLSQLKLEQPADRVTFTYYRQVVETAGDHIRALEAELFQLAEQSSKLPLIAALQSMRGVGMLTAVTIVAEVGDMRRFKSPRQFMAYTGLVPSEHSSGASVQRGHITHTGNSLLRHVLGEAAHHARHTPRIGGTLKQRQAGVPAEIVELAWRAQNRLHFRYRHLSARLGRPKALTAVARELAGFVWEMGQRMEQPAA